MLKAQNNTAYLTLTLPERGAGFRYERYFNVEPQTRRVGAYVSGSFGRYLYFYEGRLNHTKISCGAVYNIKTPEASYTNVFTLGLNYHIYSNKYWFTDPKIKSPVSFDLGYGIRVKKITIVATFDIIKLEAGISIGWSFNYK
jgi:hypothetical protein